MRYLRLLIFFGLLPTVVSAQHSVRTSTDSVLQVAVVDAPPYCIRHENGNWTGLSVELWRQAAEDHQYRYTYIEVEQADSSLAWLQDGRVDVVLRAPLLPDHVDRVDYLQNYYRTSIGMALPMTRSLWSTVKGVFSLQFLYIVLGLSALLLVVGALVYLLERKQNAEQFGGERSVWEGLGSGFWWAGVTMTTIGYGDKAPQTLAGRAVAMLWMLLALAVTSSLTAAVISATEGTPLVDFPNDLSEMDIGTVAHSRAAAFLDDKGIEYEAFQQVGQGLRQVRKQQLDLFIHDATALRYLASTRDGLTAEVQATDAEVEAFAFAVRKGSPLFVPLNASVTRITLSTLWQSTLRDYGGARPQVQGG